MLLDACVAVSSLPEASTSCLCPQDRKWARLLTGGDTELSEFKDKGRREKVGGGGAGRKGR